MTCEPLRILVVVASLSGNTRELGRRIAAHCRDAGHQVHWQEADALDGPPSITVDDADLVLLGSWTDNAGRTPAEMKAWVARLAEDGRHPRRVAVFGTGETQWGQEYFCGAVHRLARYFHSCQPALEIEQMPHGSHDARVIAGWTHAVLAMAVSAQCGDNRSVPVTREFNGESRA